MWKIWKTLISVLSSLTVSIPLSLKLLTFAMVCEALSAIFNPRVNIRDVGHKLSKTFLFACMVQIAYHFMRKYTQVNFGFDIASGVCTYYALGSGASTVINFHASGISIPPQLTGFMLRISGLSGPEKKELQEIANEDARSGAPEPAGPVKA